MTHYIGPDLPAIPHDPGIPGALRQRSPGRLTMCGLLTAGVLLAGRREVTCPDCIGALRRKEHPPFQQCSQCCGTGLVVFEVGTQPGQHRCPGCGGSGNEFHDRCPACSRRRRFGAGGES